MAFTLNEEEVKEFLEYKEGIKEVKIADGYVYFRVMNMYGEFLIDSVDPSIVEEFVKIKENEDLEIEAKKEQRRRKLMEEEKKENEKEEERNRLRKIKFCTEEFINAYRQLYQDRDPLLPEYIWTKREQKIDTLRLFSMYIGEARGMMSGRLMMKGRFLKKDFAIRRIDWIEQRVLLSDMNYDESEWVPYDSLSSIYVSTTIDGKCFTATYDTKHDVLVLDKYGDKKEYENEKDFLEDMFKLFEKE